MVETGEAAVRLVRKSGQVIDGTREKPAACFEALLPFAQPHRAAFAICFEGRDHDALWEKMKAVAPEAFVCREGK